MSNENTLVLDVGFQPVRIVPWQDAIVWVFDRLVNVIEEYPRNVLTPSPEWQVPLPSVVQFIRPLPRRRVVKFSRQAVYVRDKGRCAYCANMVPRSEYTYDHVLPRSQGGKTCFENVVVCCVPCNQKKGGRTPDQAGMHLRTQPVKPRSLPDMKGLTMEYRPGMPEGWRGFLRDSVYWDGELEHDE